MGQDTEVYGIRIKDGDPVTIHTPGAFALSDIRQETLEHTDGSIIRKSTYPNGFAVMIHQSADVIDILCNRPLSLNPDGSYTAPTDAPSAPDQSGS